MKTRRAIFSLAVVFIFLTAAAFSGCIDEKELETYDQNKELPPGEPDFPPQKVYGIVDPHNVLSQQAEEESFAIIDKLKQDGIAEVTVLVQLNVSDPDTYANTYGRFIELGEKGKNNGLVWLIRPDVSPEKNRITVAPGRGLPKLTATDTRQIMEQALDYINFGNYDRGVVELIKGTDRKLREKYGK